MLLVSYYELWLHPRSADDQEAQDTVLGQLNRGCTSHPDHAIFIGLCFKYLWLSLHITIKLHWFVDTSFARS